jgi:hypothetical protein
VNRLQKFVETSTESVERIRTVYALGTDKLPAPQKGAEWQAVIDFNARDDLLRNPSLKGVYLVAIAEGYAELPSDTTA